MKTKIDSTNFASWLATGVPCTDIAFQTINLAPYDDQLASLLQPSRPEEGCVFLGCTLGPRMMAVAAAYFGLVFPNLPGRPYDAFRKSLYTVDELFDAFDPADPNSYWDCMDWKTYATYLQVDGNHKPLKPPTYAPAGPDEILARRLHDHFITGELQEFLSRFEPKNGGRGVVAIMGGHDRNRSDARYAQVAQLARQLTSDGFLVASGGGPGLMEAANLGAFFVERSEAELSAAILAMAVSGVSDKYSDPEWLKAAWIIRTKNKPADTKRCRSLGVPTWFYGHEPPNIFATDIAKYFENSLREEGLLAIATHGVIFAEGSAGTVQEIFQDTCHNYYQTYGYQSPMILLGRAAWNPTAGEMSDDPHSPLFANKPAWPLLEKLGKMQNFSSLLLVTDSPDEALATIRNFPDPTLK